MKKIRLHQYLIRTELFKNKAEIVDVIKNNKIKVNDKLINSPDFHLRFKDKVTYQDKEIKAIKKNKYLILNKPTGYLCSRLTKKDIELKKKSVFSLIEKDKTLFCIGRLDENSEGLIIITNDGKLSNKLTNPDYKITKTYLVELTEELNSELKSKLEKGVKVNDLFLKPLKIGFGKNKKILIIILNEGKKREIRLMIDSINYEIKKLQRIKIGDLNLNELNIPLGKYIQVTNEFLTKNIK